MENPIKRPTVDMPKLSCSSDITNLSTEEGILLEPLELIDSEGVNNTLPIIAVICPTLPVDTDALPPTHTTAEVFLEQQPQLTNEENRDISDAATLTYNTQELVPAMIAKIQKDAEDPETSTKFRLTQHRMNPHLTQHPSRGFRKTLDLRARKMERSAEQCL